MSLNRRKLVAAALPKLAAAAGKSSSINQVGTHQLGRRQWVSRGPRGFSAATSRRGYVTDDQRSHTKRPYSSHSTVSEPIRDVGVIGGGLTGLTTAYYLAKRLPASAQITLYESSDSLGGWIKTERVEVDVGGKGGVVNFERGPRTMTSLHRDTWRFDDLVFYDLALDLGLSLTTPPDLPRYIYYPSHLVGLPPAMNIWQMFSEPLFLQCIGAGAGWMFRRWQNKEMPETDLSIAQWVNDIMMNKSVANNLVSAMVHGIYGGDIDKLSARTVFERFFQRYYARPMDPERTIMMKTSELDFVTSMAKDPQIRKLALRPKGSLIHFGPSGMDTLTKALEAALAAQPNVEIKTNSPVKRISYEREARKVKVEVNTKPTDGDAPRPTPPPGRLHDKVVSTLAAEHLYRICKAELPGFALAHSTNILAVNLWYPEVDIKPPGFGYLIPRSTPYDANRERALGVFFDSDVGVVGDNEPSGTKLFVLMGGHHWDGLKSNIPVPRSSEDRTNLARSVVERQLDISKDLPCVALADYHVGCIPQHFVGHKSRMMVNHDLLMHNYSGRLAVAGGSYTNIGVMGAMRAGYDIVDAILGSDGAHATGLERYMTLQEDFSWVRKEDITVRKL
ncbi:hypothetical protein HIM_01286 [Hirsutella minnesotensis 3608]|nr:hypothetical protein HIM_01286 [Hirsutella minnesotensis 3608]